MEILAPVGGTEQLTAAVRAGADAVYLGMGDFNARRGASNFDADGLKKAVAYCHGRNVKVHVTVNTLVTDRELIALLRQIRDIGDSGADAVIVQDLAVAHLFKKHLPDMPLHASTQMSIHNIAGVKKAEELSQKQLKDQAEKAGGEIRQAMDRQSAGDGRKAEEHLKNAVRMLGGKDGGIRPLSARGALSGPV